MIDLSPELPELLAIADRFLAHDRFDPFLAYPALPGEPPLWQTYWRTRLARLAADPQVRFLASDAVILAVRDSEWDRSHFGIGMATLHVLLAAEVPDLDLQLAELLRAHRELLRSREVRFVSTRVHGDHLRVLHALEDHGYRYVDNVIWPVATTAHLPKVPDPRLRRMTEADLPRVVDLAQKWAYPRGHLYCNRGFAEHQVDAMYGKWLRTAWASQAPLAVIEHDGRVEGFFQFSVDPADQQPLGHRYGHVRLFVLSGEVRGRGMGQALVEGTMVLMAQMGATHIDSGYSTKNHVSARLHGRNRFASTHEEVTLHLALG